jgi:hypothetical protein
MRPRVLGLALALTGVVGCAGGGVQQPSGDVMNIPGVGETRIDVPRPTGDRPTDTANPACDGSPLPPTSGASIKERVAALRAIGLFADRAGLDDTALAAEVKADIADLWGEAFEPTDPMLDLIVAEQDPQRGRISKRTSSMATMSTWRRSMGGRPSRTVRSNRVASRRIGLPPTAR